MDTIKQILMDRDDMSEEEADELIAEAKDALDSYLMNGEEEYAYNICEEFFGLEPDFIHELL